MTATPEAFLSGELRPDFIRDELLHEIFIASARRDPGHTSLRCHAQTLSYGQLLSRSAQTAHYLRSLGVQHGERVALWMPRGLEMYVAMLGILQAGAAYVPLDADTPPDRAAYVIRDSGARWLITGHAVKAPAEALPCRTIIFEQEESRMAACPSVPLPRESSGVTPDDCAYIIYTSGSTGRPKGVMISHRSICHLVRAESAVLGLNAADLVFQGFSLSFDMSLEEIWLAWAAGSTLLVGTADLLRAGGDLAPILERAGVTIWCCVPTLLAMQESSVATLRLLNLGGEACPPELVRRFARPGLRILNTYGPTETTITATVAEVSPERSITIGRPLPNYTCHILGENLAPLPPGEAGELCIGGPGLALGYAGIPELTAEKFVPNPRCQPCGIDPLLYRTGDLARLTADGEIEFLGRLDTQVKIRGFRVELSEIESVLMASGKVRQAVAALARDEQGVDTLVAYLVPRNGAIDEKALRADLKQRLPSYMMPAIFEVVAGLPVLPSGKVDRNHLPNPVATALKNERAIAPPATPTEARLHAVWSEIFAPLQISVEDDFFLDLGGHSLRAALMVSLARKQPGLQFISMADVYNHPTIRWLAAHVDAAPESRANASAKTAPPAEQFLPVPWWRYWSCAAAQAASLVFIFAVFSLQWLIPYLAYAVLSNWEEDKLLCIGMALALYVLAIPLMLGIGIATKWLVIGRLRPGEYPLWGWYYFRWWLVRRMLEIVPTHYLGGTPLMVLYHRLLGARIGHNVHLSDDTIDAPDCVEIGDDTSFSPGATLSCWRVENGRMKIGRIQIGRGCFVGANSSIAAGAVMGDGAELGDLSMLPRGATLPAGQKWEGSPSRFSGRAPEGSPAPVSAATRRRFAILYSALLFVFPIFAILPIFLAMMLMAEIDQVTDAYSFLLLSPVLAFLLVIILSAEIVCVKWLLLGRVKPVRLRVFSLAYVRHWLVEKLMEMSLDLLAPLYATVYLNRWYRLLGVKLGPRAEVSTASSIGFDALCIGEESFVADGVTLGVPRVHRGELVIEQSTIGRRAFIGNSAVLPAGAEIGDGVLIGVLSVPPRARDDMMRVDSSWFGTPAMFLPRRQIAAQFDEGSTFRPPRRLRAQRALIEFVRVILPISCIVALTSLMMSVVVTLNDEQNLDWSLGAVAAVFPLLYLAYGAAAGLFVIALKWLVLGRYRAVEKPLWSRFVWRSELVTSTYENLAVPFFVELLRGTLFLPAYLRLLGCKIGRRVWLETTDFTEFDVVTIGDDAALNSDCGPQTHLFEDRVMKISTVNIGARCTVGGGAIVLYDAKMEPDSSLGDLSMLMKGETLPAGTHWHGSPARRVG